MSSVNISALGQLTPSQPLDLTQYPSSNAPQSEGGSKFVTPPAGEYILRLPESFPNEAFTKSQKGTLIAQIDPTIVGPAHEGTTIRFQRVSASTFKRKGADGVELDASFMADLVKACGETGVFPGVTEDGDATPQAEMLARCAGRTFRAKVDWFAKDRKFGTGIDVKGMTKFPKNEDGSYQPYFVVEGKTDDKGRPARVWANLEVRGYITD